ncbi:Sterol 3-beta-glucosyltransferase [Collariella sp. IMI 366227]|nr:Sterol 3-beta-glucosyltransferase [Collariella sp. IMI 366227]
MDGHPSSRFPAAARSPPPRRSEPANTSQPHPLESTRAAVSQDERIARHVSRKLHKKRRDGNHTPTLELPERLKDHGGPAESEEELRPQTYGGGMFMNMNQSIFGLIAAAGSQADFADRFEGSSDDEDDVENPMAKTIAAPSDFPQESPAGQSLAQTTVLPKHGTFRLKRENRHHRKISESKLLRSVPGLARFHDKIKGSKSKRKTDTDLQDHDTAEPSAPPPADDMPSIELTRAESRTAPVMSAMLEARAQMAARPSFDLERMTNEPASMISPGDAGPTELAKQLADIFEFDRPEEVIEEYPCWLLQHVLLQGYMYITARHIAFYAYLPKKANELAKSGYLAKSGKRNPTYNRYWFRLKGDVLSYYRDPQNLYFPSGQIDLRYGISATITDKDKEGVNFTVTTNHRTYYFRADSTQSAKEWVKSLQRVIFRSHNDGDSVKISLPIENVIDIEETHMLDFAETCKIRVIDNDETYAIDEYFFSFFSFGKEAINVLKILIEDSSAQTRGQTEPSSDAQSSKRTSASREHPPELSIRTGKRSDVVRATLASLSPVHGSPSSPRHSPRHSPRPSLDRPRSSFDGLNPFSRRTMDLKESTILHPEIPHRSFSDNRGLHGKRHHDGHERQESSDSYVQSMTGDPSQASLSGLIASASSDDASASQILRGSDVFQSPTISRPPKLDGERTIVARHNTAPVKQHHHHHPQPAHSHTMDEAEAEAAAITPTLQSIATMGSFPFRKANAFMGFLGGQSKRMSNLLATESMGYVEKVSGMWKGGGKHYDEPAELKTDDEDGELQPDERANSEARFHAHFALPESEKLQAAYFGHLMRVLPLYGKIYISDRHFCFRSLLPGTRTKLILPLRDIENVDKEKGFRFGYAGLVVVIRGHEELFFEFNRAEVRDDCTITILQSLEVTRYLRDSSLLDGAEASDAQAAVAEHDALQKARHDEFADREVQLPRDASTVSDEAPTILFDDPKASFLNFKPARPMTVTCLTIGSRGDVQPYIALCKKLAAEGHHPRIATHAEFQPWIESHGIEYRHVGGDPAELMQLCIQNGTFTWAFLKEANSRMRGWLDDLLATAWHACQGSDLLIESPSAMAGIHIAEALNIPYFRAFTMPWTRTRAYPHAFIMPGQKMGGAYNYMTYVMFDSVFWKATAHQVNRWRNNMLGLPNTSLEKMQVNKVPFLYNFSPYVVPPPLDYSDWIRVTGYWFLDEGRGQGEGEKWQPPGELVEFIARARAEGKRVVYVGFGSILVPDPARMTQEVIDAVVKADVRCILSKGWSDRMPGKGRRQGKVGGGEKMPEPELPKEIFQIQSAPHDWLFGQIDAAAHHGGAGRRKWGANSFARALWEATHSERMITKARVLGEQIRKENGVELAVQSIYRDLEYATNLIKSKTGRNQSRREAAASASANATNPNPNPASNTAAAGTATDGTSSPPAVGGTDMLGDDDEEESWTFVGGESETIDDMAAQGGMNRMLGGALGGPVRRALGNRVLGGAAGSAGDGVGVKLM